MIILSSKISIMIILSGLSSDYLQSNNKQNLIVKQTVIEQTYVKKQLKNKLPNSLQK